MEFEEQDTIDWSAVVDNLQHENEELRVKLTQALKSTPLDDMVDKVVILVQRTDPMRLYIWVAIACAISLAISRIAEVFIEARK